jgi:branched-chain amino acid transport system substrate-binding protein
MFVGIRRRSLLALGALVVGGFALAPARAEDSFKIGLILPMTGGQASTGKQIDNAVKLYMKQHGDTVAGKKVEIILKDDAALPDKTKTAAQELIVTAASRARSPQCSRRCGRRWRKRASSCRRAERKCR